MNALSVFNFDTLPVRVVMIDGEPWFVAADVCKTLEIGNVSMALSRLDDEKQLIDTSVLNSLQGRENQQFSNFDPKQINIINESGLYALILTSHKPEAKRFKKWLTLEVLPTFRKEDLQSLIPPPNLPLARGRGEGAQILSSPALEPKKDYDVASNADLHNSIPTLTN